MNDERKILVRLFFGIVTVLNWVLTPVKAILELFQEPAEKYLVPVLKLLGKYGLKVLQLLAVPFVWLGVKLAPIGRLFIPLGKPFVILGKGIAKLAIVLWDYLNIALEFLWKYVVIVSLFLWKGFVIVTKPIVIVHDWLYRVLPSWVKMILSMFVWGLGQLFNKQYIKASMFFLVFFLVVSIEINTGNYGKEYDFYNDKLAGEEVEEGFSVGLIEYYFFNYDLSNNPFASFGEDYLDPMFLHHVAELNGVMFDETDVWFYHLNDDGSKGTAFSQNDFYDLEFTRDQMYEFVGSELRRVDQETGGSLTQLEIDADISAVADVEAATIESLKEIAARQASLESDYSERLDTTVSELMALDPSLEEDAALVQAREILMLEQFDDVYAEHYDVEFERNYNQDYKTYYFRHYADQFGDIVTANNDFVLAFDNYIYVKFENNQFKNESGYLMNNEDANKMLLHILYSYDEDAYDDLLEKLNNPFFEQGGYFTKGVWGVVTLGSVPQTSLVEQKTLRFLLPNTGLERLDPVFMEIKGHNSTQLLLEGIISMIVVFYLAIFFIWNVRDAYISAKKTKQNNNVKLSEKEYYADLYEDFFEYIVLTPALLLVSFISIMPIFFGLGVAFTNFAAIPGNTHIPPGQLIDWVGFENFKTVFNLTSGSSIDFAGQFWSVFSWTLIWAVAATFTCFFGGFIQAVIISNKRVVFRKFWRSLLILPWAVPALISQMIFRVMFNDTGFVNNTLNRIKITDFFRELNIFGLDFIGPSHIEAMNMNAFQRFFYMGEDTFQWLSNEANPWFVRVFIIVLNVWLGFPFFMALMSGVMTSIDKSLYEAASIDGATGYQQFKFITMPLVLFATSPLLVMTFSGNFNNFGVIYFITGGGPGGGSVDTAYAGSTDILISWIYKLTTDTSIRWYNMASVFSILIFIIIGSLSAWNFTRTRAFKEGD